MRAIGCWAAELLHAGCPGWSSEQCSSVFHSCFSLLSAAPLPQRSTSWRTSSSAACLCGARAWGCGCGSRSCWMRCHPNDAPAAPGSWPLEPRLLAVPVARVLALRRIRLLVSLPIPLHHASARCNMKRILRRYGRSRTAPSAALLVCDCLGACYDIGLQARMGIAGLHPVLKPYCALVHVRELAGHRVGIDAWSWLHR